MIGITCANGQLGQLVIGLLKEKIPAEEIVAFMRDPSKAEGLGLGVEVRPFDYDAPEEELHEILEDIDKLLMISGSEIGRRELQHRNVLLAAEKAGVSHLVYTSLLHADRSPLKLAQEHIATEMMLTEVQLPFTILRNGWYAENYIDTAKSALAAGALYGAAGEGQISAASRADYAKAAVEVLTSDGHEGKTYELSGDKAFSLSDLAAQISQISGQDIPYQNMAEADYAAALANSGLPSPWPEFLAQMDAQISEGALYDEGQILSDLIGQPTTPIAEVLSGPLTEAA